MKRCLFASTKNPEINLTPLNLTLLIWIRTNGQLSVKLNGDKMVLDISQCNIDNKWSSVNKVKVTLFDKKPYSKTASKLFKMNYEIYQAISKFKSLTKIIRIS